MTQFARVEVAPPFELLKLQRALEAIEAAGAPYFAEVDVRPLPFSGNLLLQARWP